MLPRSQHSVAVSLARIIAATRDIIHYTARFVNTFFQKKIPIFSAPPNRALRGVKARFHPAQSGRFQRLCIGSLKVSARENPVLLRRFAPLLCVSIGMSGVWFTPRSAFLLGCLAFSSRLLFAA